MTCSFCDVPFQVVSRVRGFATVPAQRERIRCPSCRVELDVYLWWPPINGRRSCAILVRNRDFSSAPVRERASPAPARPLVKRDF